MVAAAVLVLLAHQASFASTTKLSYRVANLQTCCQPPTETSSISTEELTTIRIETARWFWGSEWQSIGEFVFKENKALDVCASAGLTEKTIEFRCKESLFVLLKAVSDDLFPADTCDCDDKRTVCLRGNVWDDKALRCFVVPDNSSVARSLCYGPCDEVAYSLGLAVGVSGVAAIAVKLIN